MFSIGGSARCSRRRCQGVARKRRATFHPPGGVLLLGRRSRFLRPHPERIAAAALAHGHAVAHGDVREVGVHGVALAVVAGPATVVFPARPGLGYGSGASRRGVRAREGSRRGRASVGRGRAFSPRGGVRANAPVRLGDLLVGRRLEDGGTLLVFRAHDVGGVHACGRSGELCAPVASGQPRDRETGVFSNFPEARPARSTAGR